jgi:murein DD-endopeptidase MepM/ murein hydrolase activator NlpD
MKTYSRLWLIAGLVLASTSPALADPKLTVAPKIVRPGDPVLVTLTGVTDPPKGKAGGEALHFFAAKNGYQAVFAIPLTAKPERIPIEIEGSNGPMIVEVRETKFPETKVIVEEELANPSKEDGARIDADNAAIITAAASSKGELLFDKPFRRPVGGVTSTFGEWRTFNDGGHSQHLGLDLFAREGSKVAAVGAGTVALVRETFLAGNVVVLVHGGGVATAYFHLSKVSVKQGDEVAAGDEIGLAGHTGRTTGPHLHLSVRVSGGFVDPASFFKLAISPPPRTPPRSTRL